MGAGGTPEVKRSDRFDMLEPVASTGFPLTEVAVPDFERFRRISLVDGADLTRLDADAMTGVLRVFDRLKKERVRIDSDNGVIEILDSVGNVVVSVGRNGDIVVGGHGHDGDLVLKDTAGNDRIRLDAQVTNLEMLRADGTKFVELGRYGNLVLGGGGLDGDILLRKSNGTETIHLDGDAGDIILKNADCAEEFDVADGVVAEPGSVMALDQQGRLELASRAYDRCVAGVVSGAGSYRPGIVLDRQAAGDGRLPLALVGKVFCRVDATEEPIAVGDLLTSSNIPGVAMKAADPSRAFGAVLGKALAPLPVGRGLIPVLVALQ